MVGRDGGRLTVAVSDIGRNSKVGIWEQLPCPLPPPGKYARNIKCAINSVYQSFSEGPSQHNVHFLARATAIPWTSDYYLKNQRLELEPTCFLPWTQGEWLCFVTLFVLDERAVTLGSRPKASHRSDAPLGMMAERGRRMETRRKTSFPKMPNEYIWETLSSFSPKLRLLRATLVTQGYIRAPSCIFILLLLIVALVQHADESLDSHRPDV